MLPLTYGQALTLFRYAGIGKWRVQIGSSGPQRYLGDFDSKEAAVRVATLAKRDLGFHPNHGGDR
jgi:hypothetical protein